MKFEISGFSPKNLSTKFKFDSKAIKNNGFYFTLRDLLRTKKVSENIKTQF